jgi:uncharacterized protein (UPF0276 family)
MLPALPALGVGLGYREPYRGNIFLHQGEVDFLEIVADHYLDVSSAKERELELLAAHFTLIPHGLNLSLGSAEGLDLAYLRKLAALVRRLDPPWWSEHIAFTRAGGMEIGHLTPLPYTREALNALARNVALVRQYVDAPLILENVAALFVLPVAEMDEAAFVAEAVERADCGLLLDATNLHANAVNHGFDALAYLARLPLDRVVQLHYVGGHWRQGVLIDSHSRPTPPDVWALLDAVVARALVKGAVLERDDNLPPFDALLEELDVARGIGRRHGRWP